jgi:hypothetical protein
MDTNTGQILTPEQIKKDLEKAMLLTGKQLDLTRQIKAERVDRNMSPVPGMTHDEAMAKFMPDVVPLKRLPNKGCKKCYGQGYTGRNVLTKKFVPCSCAL